MNPEKMNFMKKRAEALAAQGVAPNLIPGVKVGDLKDVKCMCGGEVFIPAHAVKVASPLQTRNGAPTMVQIPYGFMCHACGELNNFNPEGMPNVTGTKEVPKPEDGGGDLGVSVSEKVKSGEALG
jgi:hypothetical protein